MSLPDMPHVRRISVSSLLVFTMNHFLSRTPCASCPRFSPQKKETRKDLSIVLILQEQFCTSELAKVIQDAASLILLCRTML